MVRFFAGDQTDETESTNSVSKTGLARKWMTWTYFWYIKCWMISYLTATTQPDTQNIHMYDIVSSLSKLKKYTIFDQPTLFFIFKTANMSEKQEVAILEMGWHGPILDLKLIPLVSFFTATIARNMNYGSIKN